MEWKKLENKKSVRVLHYTPVQKVSNIIIVEQGQIGFLVGIVDYREFQDWVAGFCDGEFAYTVIEHFLSHVTENTLEYVKGWVETNMHPNLAFFRW